MNLHIEDISTHTQGFLSSLSPRESRATVVFLSGDLGAGKTTFVTSLAKDLGVEEDISSPTFVILKRYKTKDIRFPYLVHIDAYRLGSFEELRKIKIEEYLKDTNNLICIEWPEMVVSDVLQADKTITLSHGSTDDLREISIL